MMRGQIVFRQFGSDNNLQETTKSFSSLEQLFELCLTNTDKELVDRVHIDGTDSEGKQRQLTLVFQSITIEDNN